MNSLSNLKLLNLFASMNGIICPSFPCSALCILSCIRPRSPCCSLALLAIPALVGFVQYHPSLYYYVHPRCDSYLSVLDFSISLLLAILLVSTYKPSSFPLPAPAGRVILIENAILHTIFSFHIE